MGLEGSVIQAMGKHKILFPTIIGLLALGSLGSCRSGTSTSQPGSTSAPSSTSESTTSQTSTQTPVIPELDLTAAPLSHNAVSVTDAEVVKIAAVGSSDVTKIEQVPAEAVVIIKNLISKAYLTAAQVDLVVTCAKDIVSGVGKATYAEAATSFAAFFPHLSAALASIDGDQIGYFIQEGANYLQGKERNRGLPSGLIFSLRTLGDYQGALSAFVSTYPDFVSQYNLYSSYFDGSTAYRESASEGNLALTTSFALALGRAIHALLLSAVTVFNAEEKSLLLASLASRLSDDNLPYASEIKDQLTSLRKNPVSLLNHLGQLLLAFRITKGSWTAIHDHALVLIKGIFSLKKSVYFRSRSVNMTYVNGLLDFIESKKDVINGDQLSSLVKLAGNLLVNFSAADNEAITKAQGETPVNPLTQLLALYDKAYAALTSGEKSAIVTLFSNLGFSYSEIYGKFTEWKGLDLSQKSNQKTISDYLAALAKSFLAFFTPGVSPLKVDVFLIEPFLLRGTVINAKRFDIDLYASGDSVDNYSITDIVAPTSELGYHVGTFRLNDRVSGKSFDYAFGYDVVPTYIGMDPNQYPYFSSSLGYAAYQNGVLYLQEGTSLDTLRTLNVSSLRFLEADGTPHDVSINDSALTLALSSTAVGDGYLLLAYRVSEQLTIYGVMKTHIFAESTISYVGSSGWTYVILNGDNTVYVMKTTPAIDDEGYVTLTDLYLTLSVLGIKPDAVGDKSYLATYLTYHFELQLRVVDPSVCHLDGIADFMPYLQTSYKVGDEFNLTGLKLYYTYTESSGITHSVGTLIVQHPHVTVVGFSTANPTSSARATVTYESFSFSFYYSVSA
jgi:hypothetical protein